MSFLPSGGGGVQGRPEGGGDGTADGRAALSSLARERGALRVPSVVEIRDVARLALPIVVVQIGMMLMGAVDTAMARR